MFLKIVMLYSYIQRKIKGIRKAALSARKDIIAKRMGSSFYFIYMGGPH